MPICVNCSGAKPKAIITISGVSLLEYTPNPQGYITGDLPNGVHVLDRTDPGAGLVKSGVGDGCVAACDIAHPGKAIACQWPSGLEPSEYPPSTTSLPFYHCGRAYPGEMYPWLTSCFWISPSYGDVTLNSMSSSSPSARFLIYWRDLHFVAAWTACEPGPDDTSLWVFLIGRWEQAYPATSYTPDWTVHTRLNVVEDYGGHNAPCSLNKTWEFYPCWIWPLPSPPVPPYRWGNYIYPTDPPGCGWQQCYTGGAASLTWAD
jgi:hypothetical protein